MTRTFEQMCAERDPVYVTQPHNWFAWAVAYDYGAWAQWKKQEDAKARDSEMKRDAELFKFTIRALRNQGQPYYDVRQP